VVVSKFSYHTGSKMILAKSKWPIFAHSCHKICAQRPGILIGQQNHHV
jgi:hypothetical protein